METDKKENKEQEKEIESHKRNAENEKSKVEQDVKNEELITKSEDKKKEKKQIIRKEKAVLYGKELPISTKHSMAICDFIRGKSPEKMIEEMEKVIKLKKAIPMKGEIPHRKGMGSGRYPINASKLFIKLLKTLIGNSNVNGIENPVISLAKADRASRPHRRFGSERFKRTNVYLEAREAKKK